MSFLFRSMHTFDVTGFMTELPMLTQYAYAPVLVEPCNLGVHSRPANINPLFIGQIGTHRYMNLVLSRLNLIIDF